jgi:hypothetical protein
MAITAKAKEASLESVYQELEKLLKQYMPPFKPGGFTVRGKPSFHLAAPELVAIPGAYGGKPTELNMASLILQKGYVGFYLSGIPEMRKKLSPELLKLLKGKACFHLKTLDDGLRKGIKEALELGTNRFKDRGWV